MPDGWVFFGVCGAGFATQFHGVFLGGSRVTGGPSNYWGQGFSPRGDKSRFVLPADFRATVLAASGQSPTLCLDKHHKLPCLVGFGLSRAEAFADQFGQRCAQRPAGRPGRGPRSAGGLRPQTRKSARYALIALTCGKMRAVCAPDYPHFDR